MIRSGKLINKLNFLLQHAAGETMTALVDAFLTQYYSEATSLPRELILPVRTSLSENDLLVIARSASVGRATKQSYQPVQRDDKIAALRPPGGVYAEYSRPRNDIKVSVPARGKKRDLIKLGEENAKEYLEQSRARWERANDNALAELKSALKLKELPKRIEGYDISNIQGTLSVGSMAVFVDGKPDTNEYRKFKIKTVKGADDFASLAEVLKRRFKKSKVLPPPGSPETAEGISGVILWGS